MEQYKALESGSEHLRTICMSSTNKIPKHGSHDDNRIVLQTLVGHRDCQEPYVNACYVDGYSQTNKFIATQGPLPTTLVHFWHLVWQEKPSTIVMVTNVIERGKVKCEQYWPDSGAKRFGPFQITTTDQQMFADYTVRVLQVAFADSPGKSMKVTQYHYTAWPDHGVPEYATSMLDFHQRVKSQHNTIRGPMLVHCSAGVGRTGTFIAIDCVLEQADREQVVDIAGTVNKLRHQRTKMVQTVDQYVFLHDAILEAVTCGDTQIPAGNLYIALRKLRKLDPATGLTGLGSQFQVLNQVSPKPAEVSRNTALRYKHNNCTVDFLPADHTRVLLKREQPGYIHASFVNGYRQKRAFIIAQGPMESTCRDFWKMVHDRRCGVIVMLSQLQENEEEVCHQYWPDADVQEFGEMEVELLNMKQCDGYTVTRSRESHQVTQFQVQNWSSSGQCSNFSTVLEVLEEMGSVQRRTGNTPVVVHCSDTVGHSGMFCAIATTIEKCKTEGVVDVFQIVKALRVTTASLALCHLHRS